MVSPNLPNSETVDFEETAMCFPIKHKCLKTLFFKNCHHGSLMKTRICLTPAKPSTFWGRWFRRLPMLIYYVRLPLGWKTKEMLPVIFACFYGFLKGAFGRKSLISTKGMIDRSQVKS